MSNVINAIVVAAINDGIEGVNIPSFARPQVDAAIGVIAADLEGRAESIAEIIRARGIEAGLSESDVENVLIETGLADAPVVDEPEAQESLSEGERDVALLAAAVATLATTVEKIVAAAGRQGIQI